MNRTASFTLEKVDGDWGDDLQVRVEVDEGVVKLHVPSCFRVTRANALALLSSLQTFLEQP